MLSITAFSGPASAEEEPDFLSKWGLAVTVGGGAGDFIGEDMRDMTGVAGAWDARVIFGTKQIVGVEAGYLGSLQSIDALGLDTDAQLMSNGAEALVRLHFLPGMIQPYAFAGAGWRRYDLTNVETNTSSVTEKDDVFEIPVGLGVSFRYEHLLIDVRGAFRPSFDDDLVPSTNEEEESALSLDTFQFGARVGYEF
jgi:hypothetical protein